MNEQILWVMNSVAKTSDSYLPFFSREEAQKAKNFHQSFPQYKPTPLVPLPFMANHLGIDAVYIKDESYRFGLNSFKVLGGSYAIACYIASQLKKEVAELNYEVLTSEDFKKEFGHAVFFTATDGNHGRGIAWAAKKLHQKSVVYMPKGSSFIRFHNIEKEGAQTTICDMNYDECVRLAKENAKKTRHGVIIQDTAWEGYEDIPISIMQGYMTMAFEARLQLEALNRQPTHIFLQAGVGSMAGAVCGYFMNTMKPHPPKIIIVEARAADCLYESALLHDGSMKYVTGDLNTIMAGLACGEPNPIGWDVLLNHADAFLSITDSVAATGMRMLAAPLKHDKPVTSGESGAAGFAALAAICTKKEYAPLREALELTKDSRVLIFSTEGDTDPKRYESIVWGGNDA